MTTILDDAFDHEKEEGMPDPELLPAGDYLATIIDSQVGPMRNGKGTEVVNMWSVVEPIVHEKRTVFQHCYIQHESEKAQQFGRARLKETCTGIGLLEPLTDLSALLFKECVIKVKISRDKSGQGYPDRNEITRVSPGSAWEALKKLVKTATSTPKAFDATRENMNDEVPF
jgi:Protein of unknown function (DUF669)